MIKIKMHYCTCNLGTNEKIVGTNQSSTLSILLTTDGYIIKRKVYLKICDCHPTKYNSSIVGKIKHQFPEHIQYYRTNNGHKHITKTKVLF